CRRALVDLLLLHVPGEIPAQRAARTSEHRARLLIAPRRPLEPVARDDAEVPRVLRTKRPDVLQLVLPPVEHRRVPDRFEGRLAVAVRDVVLFVARDDEDWAFDLLQRRGVAAARAGQAGAAEPDAEAVDARVLGCELDDEPAAARVAHRHDP